MSSISHNSESFSIDNLNCTLPHKKQNSETGGKKDFRQSDEAFESEYC